MLGHELRNPLSPIVTALQLMRLRGAEASSRSARSSSARCGTCRAWWTTCSTSRASRAARSSSTRSGRRAARASWPTAVEMASPLLEERRHELERRRAPRGLLRRRRRAAPGPGGLEPARPTRPSTPSPGGRIEVIARGRGGRRSCCACATTAIGIARRAAAARVRAVRAGQPQAIDRSHGGLGLGLAIVRSLVALHGGTRDARAATAPGRGSEFSSRLPAARRRPTPTRAGPAARGTRRRGAGASARVLVVDDNRDAADDAGRGAASRRATRCASPTTARPRSRPLRASSPTSPCSTSACR